MYDNIGTVTLVSNVNKPDFLNQMKDNKRNVTVIRWILWGA